MAFVAQVELKVTTVGSSKVTVYKPGDVIPDFAKWDTVARRAHLNLDYVKDDPSKFVESKSEAKRKQTQANAKQMLPKVAEVSTDAGVETFNCALCEGKSFKSSKGLKTHITLAHTNKG